MTKRFTDLPPRQRLLALVPPAVSPADVEEQRVPLEHLTVVEPHVTQAPVVAVQPGDGRFDDGDADRPHTF